MSSDPDDLIGGYHAYATDAISDGGFEGPWARKLVGALALLADGIAEGAKQAIKLRFPSICPPDALDPNGSTYGHPRYPYEGDDAYRRRLGVKWQVHEESGSKYGINRAFQAAGLNAVLYESWEWDDGQDPTAEWFRVYVLLPLDRTDRVVELWDDPGVWDDGGLWQDDRETEVEIVRAILRQHKPAHAVVSGIFISLAGGYWDFPDDVWDSGDPADVWDSDQIERASYLVTYRGAVWQCRLP